MLEALIRTKNSKSLDKRMGDVICVKLKEKANWGAMEIRVHQPVDWEDESLEKQMRIDGIDTKITPYKQIKKEHFFVDKNGDILCICDVTLTRSRKYFDIDSIEDEDLKLKIISDEYFVSILDSKNLIKTKNKKDIKNEFRANCSAQRHEIEKKKPSPEIQGKEEEIKILERHRKLIEKTLKENEEDFKLIENFDKKIQELKESKPCCQ